MTSVITSEPAAVDRHQPERRPQLALLDDIGASEQLGERPRWPTLARSITHRGIDRPARAGS